MGKPTKSPSAYPREGTSVWFPSLGSALIKDSLVTKHRKKKSVEIREVILYSIPIFVPVSIISECLEAISLSN